MVCSLGICDTRFVSTVSHGKNGQVNEMDWQSKIRSHSQSDICSVKKCQKTTQSHQDVERSQCNPIVSTTLRKKSVAYRINNRNSLASTKRFIRFYIKFISLYDLDVCIHFKFIVAK